MKKRIYEFPPILFDYFSKVGYFPDGNNNPEPKIKKVKKNDAERNN